MAASLDDPWQELGNASQQIWSPCTRQLSIHSYIYSTQFPITFRNLSQQWIALGKPHLFSLRYPQGLLYSIDTSAPTDIDLMSSFQEITTLGIFAGYMKKGIVPSSKPFEEIASHMHIYSAIKVEMDSILHHYSEAEQVKAYELQWRSMVTAFDQDRQFCLCQPSHGCMGRLLWGDTYLLNVEDIRAKFEEYSRSVPGNVFRPFSVIRSHLQQQQALPALLAPFYPPLAAVNPGQSSAVRLDFPSHETLQSKPSTNTSEDSTPSTEDDSPPPALVMSSGISSNLPHCGSSSSSSSNTSSMGKAVARSPFWTSNAPPDMKATQSASLQRQQAQQAESRAEQNRRKSKKHYERKKLQRALLGDLVLNLESTLKYLAEQNRADGPLFQAIQEAILTRIPFDPASSTSGSEAQTPASEKKKMNKRLQNHLEFERITQLSKAAEAMIDVADISTASCRSLLSLSGVDIESIHRGQLRDAQDIFLLTWLHCKGHWGDLVSAEHRLSRNETKPIAKLISSLHSSSTSIGASSA